MTGNRSSTSRKGFRWYTPRPYGPTFSATVSLAGDGVATLGRGFAVVVRGRVEKLKVGRLKALIGREMAGRSSTSATWRGRAQAGPPR